MTGKAKTVFVAVGVFAILQGMKELLGYGPTLVVATAAFSFCVGAIWMAGRAKGADQ